MSEIQNDTPVAVDTDETPTGEKEVEVGTDPGSTPPDLAEIKSMLETFNNDIASLKRSVKKASKPNETPEKTTTPEDSGLVEKFERMALKTAGITHADDVELAQTTAKKWGVEVDELLEDVDFQVKLERQQTERKNDQAVSNVKGDKAGGGGNSAKEDPAYWLAKGQPPTAEDVPDRKIRAKIARAFIAEQKGVGKNPYYNGK